MKITAQPRPLKAPLDGGVTNATVTVEPLEVGTMQAPAALLESAGRFAQARMLGLFTPRSRWWTLPCPAFLITHPGAGAFLVDTGLHPSVTDKPRANLGRIVSWYSKPQLPADTDLPAQLRERGIDARSIRTVVMTHMHFDHASGMAEFPAASFILSKPEWEAATEGSRPLLDGYRPSQFDYAFDYRTLDYDDEGNDSYSTFGRTFDLFGDGSVRLAFTPGHSAGHQSVICRLRDRDLVIAGDAIYTLGQLDDAPAPPRPFDPHTFRRSLQELRLFRTQYPDAVIIPGHDPKTWPGLKRRYE